MKNGTSFWEYLTISPIINSNGKLSNFLIIGEDITEKKKLTEELIKAKEKAEEADRLKSSFLANMSHEIRTPMNSIMGFASLLPDEESKETLTQYAQIILQNSEQLVSIIDGIVMYSKLQTRMFAYHPSDFVINKLFKDIQQSFNLPEYNKDVDLIIEQNLSEEEMIKTDYDKLRQIFTNLISNAFKYTETGKITFGCKTNDKTIEFFVNDTGIGIPEKEKNLVFDRFTGEVMLMNQSQEEQD
jgi:signal transduction histidine kinase